MSDNKEFTVPILTTKTFKEGWGVFIDVAWDEDEETGREWISDIDVEVVRIAEDEVCVIGGTPCIRLGENSYMPVENFVDVPDLSTDDTHDLRSRWFATEEDARGHASYTLGRWHNPAPWESFVKLD